MLWFHEKHLSGVVSNLEHFPLTQQNENEITYERKTNENLNEQHISFLNVQNHKKSYSETTFRIILLLSPTEINRAPRSLL